MANSLVKLIEYSLLPVALLLLGKLIGLYVTAALFEIELGVVSVSDTIFNFRPAVAQADLLILSSYSDLFMFLLIALAMTFVLVTAVYMHDTHINTKTINLLAKYNLLFLMKSSFQLYHSGIIWLLFSWVASAVILVDVLIGKTYAWVLIVAVIFSISLSVVFFRDLFKELELSKRNLIAGK